MKRICLALFFVILVLQSYAQTQQGLVRTVGTSTAHGKPIADATVKLRGNANNVVSDNAGKFSLPMSGKKEGEAYQLLNVIKSGYEFADKDFLSKKFAFSSKNPLEVVMISSAELAKTKQEIEDRTYKTVQDGFNKKIKNLEAECESGSITIEIYRERHQLLMDQFEDFEAIINDMAEHYARTDYDKLDSLDAIINTSIIEGDLVRADILIAKKGNLDERIAVYQRHAKTNKEARNMLDKLSEEIAQQRAQYEKERKDISNDLYNKHSIAISRFEFDDALEYMKMRAYLDTTNVETMREYSELCYKQNKFEECESCYQICLRNDKDLSHTAPILCNLGNLYHDIDDYINSKRYYQLALKKSRELYQRYNDEYSMSVLATTLNNIGNLYADIDNDSCKIYYMIALENYEILFKQNPNEINQLGLANAQLNYGIWYREHNDYTNSERLLKLALEHCTQLYKNNPDSYEDDLANRQHNLGTLYYYAHNYYDSERYYCLALDHYEHLFKQNPEAYRDKLASTQHFLGLLYYTIQDYVKSEKFSKLALKNREYLFKLYPNAYRSAIAETQDLQGLLYNNIYDYTNSEYYFKLSSNNYHQLFNENPKVYHKYLAASQNNLGLLYFTIHDYDSCEVYSNLALKNYEYLHNQNPNLYTEDMAKIYNNLGNLYRETQNYKNSEKFYKLSLKKYEELFKNTPETYRVELAATLNNFSYLYAGAKKYSKAIEMINKAIALMPTEANFYDSKGEILLMQGKDQEALDMWKKVLELDPNFLDNYPDGSNFSNGLKKLGLIK